MKLRVKKLQVRLRETELLAKVRMKWLLVRVRVKGLLVKLGVKGLLVNLRVKWLLVKLSVKGLLVKLRVKWLLVMLSVKGVTGLKLRLTEQLHLEIVLPPLQRFCRQLTWRYSLQFKWGLHWR